MATVDAALLADGEAVAVGLAGAVVVAAGPEEAGWVGAAEVGWPDGCPPLLLPASDETTANAPPPAASTSTTAAAIMMPDPPRRGGDGCGSGSGSA